MTFSFLSVAVKNLRQKFFRMAVLVTSVGPVICIADFGISFSMSVGSSIERASARLGADLLVAPMGARDFSEEVLPETKGRTFYMDRSIVERVREMEGIEDLTHKTYLSIIRRVKHVDSLEALHEL